jgi:hypothetical protein
LGRKACGLKRIIPKLDIVVEVVVKKTVRTRVVVGIRGIVSRLIAATGVVVGIGQIVEIVSAPSAPVVSEVVWIVASAP